MTPPSRTLRRAGAGVLGAALGAALVLIVNQATTRSSDPPLPRARTQAVSVRTGPRPDVKRMAPAATPVSRVLLAWAPGGLPANAEAVVEKVRGARATTVSAHLDWLESSRAEDGHVLDDPPDGMAIPFEIAAVEPREYAQFVAPDEAPQILALRSGTFALARTATELRRGGAGMKLVLQSGHGEVESVVSDTTTNGYEALTAGPPHWDGRFRFVLIKLRNPGAADAVKHAVRALMGSDADLVQFRSAGENPFLRYGDAVLPQMLVKQRFGEFAARPQPDGTIDIDPAWVKANIVTRELPLVGSATCHRELLPQLISALDELRDEGLGHLVHPAQFAGCFSPRFIGQDPNGNLSHHAWGMAVDLNANENPRGSEPHMDRRVIGVFEKWGFTWGGDWILPDGMHFEWISPP